MNNHDLLDRIASMNPVTDVEAERHLTPNRWQAMFVEIVSSEDPGSGRLDVARRPRGRRVFIGVAAGALAFALALPALWPNSPGGASPAAADALRHAADVARSERALPAPGPGQYLYARSRERSTPMYVPGHGLPNFLFTEAMDVESWTSQDGSGRVVIEPRGITFPTASDRAAWESAGRPDLLTPGSDDRDSPGERYTLDLAKVPTDPDELLAAIERREILGGDDADWVTFQIIGELLHLSYSSPEHRAALYEVAANLPGVQYEGHVTDPAGRRGVSVSFAGGGHRQEMIFDPHTAELLGERQVLLEQEEAGVDVGPDTWPGTIIAFAGPPGTVVFWKVYLEAAVVDSTNQRPQLNR